MFEPSQLRRYFWSVFGVIGVVMLWAGIWEGLGGLPYLELPLVSLLVGIVMLSFSGFFNQQFSPLQEVEKSINKVLLVIHRHPRKHEFHVQYQDHLKKKSILLRLDKLSGIERGSFIVLSSKHEGETFIPIHRIKEVLHKGKSYWRPS